MKVYYAHFMGLYNTLQENRDIETLKQLGLEVVNPNCESISKAFNEAKDQMDYMEAFDKVFFEEVRQAEVFAFRGLPDGRIPGGVALELNVARDLNKIIIELPSAFHARKMNAEQTREYLTEMGQR